jgi:hypothetical protein
MTNVQNDADRLIAPLAAVGVLLKNAQPGRAAA